ncbi:MAG: hypothetical protein Q8M03_17025 [Legionella sp.]|nr:hypothetical protein [Legionella sp.]
MLESLFKKAEPLVPSINGRLELPEEFDYKSAEHLKIITRQIERFTTALEDLQSIDRKIYIAGGTCLSAYIGTCIFSITWLSILSSAVSGWYLKAHFEKYPQYHEALEDLIKTYEWAMGKDTGKHWYKFPLPQIQELIETLGPWVTSNRIHTWKDTDLTTTSLFNSVPSPRKDISEAFHKRLAEFAAGKQAKGWNFSLYGEDGMGIKARWELLCTKFTSDVVDAAANLCFNHKLV